MHLKLQDFKSVSDYNLTLLKISSQLKLYGEKVTKENMFEKKTYNFPWLKCAPTAATLRMPFH